MDIATQFVINSYPTSYSGLHYIISDCLTENSSYSNSRLITITSRELLHAMGKKAVWTDLHKMYPSNIRLVLCCVYERPETVLGNCRMILRHGVADFATNCDSGFCDKLLSAFIWLNASEFACYKFSRICESEGQQFVPMPEKEHVVILPWHRNYFHASRQTIANSLVTDDSL